MGFKAFFCTLSGDDFGIIRKCSPDIKRHFTAVGLLVAFISLLCFTSFLFLFAGLIDSLVLALMLALFFTWMILNIYLLLLYTLSSRVLTEEGTPSSVISPNFLKYSKSHSKTLDRLLQRCVISFFCQGFFPNLYGSVALT